MSKLLIFFSRHILFGFILAQLNVSIFGQNLKNQISEEAVPRVEIGKCALDIPKEEKNVCGYLIVYENRISEKKRMIRLPFIIMKSDSRNPLPDPILYTSGGPGSSSLKQVNNRQYIPYLKNRDYILFEQRGTKYAEPALNCPEVNDVLLSAVKRSLPKRETTEDHLKAARLCRKRLIANDIDLSAYNSAASADDIEDLRRLLGFEKWNLYGVSYSTRLMLTVVRHYPNGVRSVVLDSVLPPSVNYDETSVDSVVRSLNLLFAACKANTQCQNTYPNLEKQFYSLVEKADNKPFVVSLTDSKTRDVTKLFLTGTDIINAVYDALETGYKLASIPSLIAGAENKNHKALTEIAKIKLDSSNFALGMRYSVWCSEEMPFENRRLIEKQFTSDYPKLRGFGIQSDFPKICDIWKVKPVNRIENEAVKSNIPTLILAGQYDPDTPPDWGKLASKTLSKSYFFELPATSHVPTFSSNCAQELAVAFFDDPQKAPDSQCINKIDALKFEIR